jgi:hypothetical protein
MVASDFSFFPEIPDRLAIMAKDAHEDIVFSSGYLQDALDSIKRVAVLVEDEDSDFPPVAQAIQQPALSYSMLIVGKNFGQGGRNNQEQKRIREVTGAVINYMWKRPQLQFSNTRGLEPAPLTSLRYVTFARIRATGVRPMQRGTEFAFWGAVITVTVNVVAPSQEILV